MRTPFARGKWVIVERVAETTSIIELGDAAKEAVKHKAIVVSVGSEVENISIGDEIIFVLNTQNPFVVDGKTYDAVQQQTVMCVLHRETDVN